MRQTRLRAVPAVVRAVAILRLLRSSVRPLGVSEIARELDMVPSTCLHILRVLTREGLITADTLTKRYRFGAEILTFTQAALRDSIAEHAQPYLELIAQQHPSMALAVTVSTSTHFVVVAKSLSDNTLDLNVDLGARFPALLGATGRCVAAYAGLPRRDLKAQFKHLRWQNAPAYEEWERQIASVHKTGYAVDDGNLLSNTYIIASPIVNAVGELRHAVAGVCAKEGQDKISLQRFAGSVRANAMVLSEWLYRYSKL